MLVATEADLERNIGDAAKSLATKRLGERTLLALEARGGEITAAKEEHKKQEAIEESRRKVARLRQLTPQEYAQQKAKKARQKAA